MKPQDTTIANADLWGKYFEQQWSWLKPIAGPDATQVAAASGARIANFLTLVAAGPIAWLYANNAPNVTPLRPLMVSADYPHDMESVEDAA